MQAPSQMTKPSTGRRLWRRIINHWEFYLLLLPMLVVIFVFKYVPMYGVQIAFKDFKASLGIMGSPWADPLLKHFMKFFNSYNFSRLVINTFLLSFETLVHTVITAYSSSPLDTARMAAASPAILNGCCPIPAARISAIPRLSG